MLKHIKEMVACLSLARTGGLLPILLFGAVLAVSAAPASADKVTSTWIGGDPGDWHVAGNWSPSGVPNNSFTTQYNVVIDDPDEGPYIDSSPSVKIDSLTIEDADGYVDIRDAGSLELADSGGLDNSGTVKIQAGGILLLNGGTVTNQTIELLGTTGTSERAILRLKSDTTLSPAATATEILGKDPDDTSGLPGSSPQTPDGLIDGDGKLTLPSSGAIKGELEIQVELANSGLVDADNDAGKILLTGTTKSGGSAANFKATAGLLEVNSTVTGTADWTSSGTGYLYITSGGDINGTDMNILKVGSNSGGVKVSGPVTLAGNLDATVTVNGRWLWNAACKFTGGRSGSPVTIELASKDVFNPSTSWDLAWPYSSMGMGLEVIIGADAHLKGVDNSNNGNTGGMHCTDAEECFFVTTLTFVDGDGRYDRNGRDAHFDTLNGNLSQILGDPFCD